FLPHPATVIATRAKRMKRESRTLCGCIQTLPIAVALDGGVSARVARRCARTIECSAGYARGDSSKALRAFPIRRRGDAPAHLPHQEIAARIEHLAARQAAVQSFRRSRNCDRT